MFVLNDVGKCAVGVLLMVWLAGCGIRTSPAAAENESGPVADSIDCATPADTRQNIVCSNAQLAALNREVARLSQLARAGPAPDYDRDLRAWARTRDRCAGADMRQCLTASYAGRIFDLREDYPEVRADVAGASSGPVALSCTNIDARIGAVFIASPALVRLEWLNRSVTLGRVPGATGATYSGGRGGQTAIFWREGESVSFKAPGQSERRCAILPTAG